MRQYIPLLCNIAIVTVFLLTVDGCLYRDPYVALSHGYAIVAISPSSPCGLHYYGPNDSDWTALQMTDQQGRTTFVLSNTTGEELEYDSEEKWRAAIREKHADPPPFRATLSDITGYKANRDFAIGTSAEGYWLLAFAAHRLDIWKDAAAWQRAVADRTSLTTSGLRDPHGWVYQTRDPGMLLAYAALAGTAVFLGWRRCRRKPQPTA